ncbi:hypothetical protein Sste5346_006224 [Sporothrix stenoceras]|uniref:protein disulfide-isomerase n=1 Tax=Sporothrix stenoceras TaxID=5173 RepID=A0ABR3YZC3_9PEZI
MQLKTLMAVVATLAGMHQAMAQQGLYSKDSPVTQITNKAQLDRIINESNRTSIIEFYAPWCGHCKNLKPEFEKAARSLDGLANVVAINCEDAKDVCRDLGVQGYPTLKIARPPKAKAKGRRTVVDDYQGQRTAAGIVDSLTSQMNNHVVKVTDATLDEFLTSTNGAKALLFTEKGTTAPSTKALATDFLGSIVVGQVRSKEANTVAKYGVTSFPTLLLLTDDDATPIAHEGKFKLKEMVAFLSQAAEPNPPVDLNGKKPKAEKPKKEKKAEKKEKAEEKEKANKEEESTTETPTQQTAPVIVESALPIPTIHTIEKLESSCLSDKAPTCVLVFVGDASSDEASADTQEALNHLADVAHKYAQSKRALFPFYAVPASNPASEMLLESMNLRTTNAYDRVQLVAVNARRKWWRRYEGGAGDISHESIEQWIDDIRMGEGAKQKLPESVVVKAEKAVPKEEKVEEPKAEEPVEEVKHEEL